MPLIISTIRNVSAGLRLTFYFSKSKYLIHLAYNSQTTLTLHHCGLEPATLQTEIQLELWIEFISDIQIQIKHVKNTKQKEKGQIFNQLTSCVPHLFIYISIYNFLYDTIFDIYNPYIYNLNKINTIYFIIYNIQSIYLHLYIFII